MNKHTVQIQELQVEVNFLHDSRDFHDSETVLSHVPRGMHCRDSCPQPETRNLFGKSELQNRSMFLYWLLHGGNALDRWTILRHRDQFENINSASFLKKIIQNSSFKKSQSCGAEGQVEDRFLRGRQIALMRPFFIVLIYSALLYMATMFMILMGRNFDINQRSTLRRHSGKFVQDAHT